MILIALNITFYLLSSFIVDKWLSDESGTSPNIEELIENMQLNLLFD